MKAHPPLPHTAQRIAALWNGVRMRKVHAGVDPDAPTRLVTLPADWEDAAASALAQLAPGAAPVSIAQAAGRWVRALAADPRASAGLAQRLVMLLQRRAAAPNRPIWQQSWQQARDEAPAFVLNLAAFAQGGAGFDAEEYVAALATLTEALRLLASPSGRSGRILLGNLDACLAALGLDYDSEDARDTAACLLALATASAHPERAPRHGGGKLPPAHCAVPWLSAHARAAWQQAAMQVAEDETELFPEAGQIETGLSAPGPVDALLGFEACGIAPVFSPLRPDGRLAASTLARLAARNMSPEAAFAASLAGESVLATADQAALQAMHRAIAPFIDRMPALPSREAAPEAASQADRVVAGAAPPLARRELPSRHGGFTQKASVGGHRLFLRTGEYEDGSLGEISISPVREGPAQRGLMEAFSQAVSLGLQHGVPLDAYVEAFAYTRFGPGGVVEGDSAVSSATSLLDYAFRTLAHAYLGRTLPDAAASAQAANGGPGQASDEGGDGLLPLDLPLDLPRGGHAGPRPGIRQRHGLRLVG